MANSPTGRVRRARRRAPQPPPLPRALVWNTGVRVHELAIARAVARVAQVVPCHTETLLLDELARPGRKLVLVELASDGSPAPAALIALVKRHHAEVPVLGYCWLGPAVAGQIVEAARAGLDGLALRGYDDVAAEVRALLATEQVDEAFILRELDDVVPDDVLPWVRVALERAGEGPNCSLVAGALGCSPRTMQRLATRHGVASPAEIVACTRLLLAARLLAHRKRPAREAARRAGYATVGAMRRAFHRHDLAPPETMRGTAAWRSARDRLLARMGGLRRPRSAPERAPRELPALVMHAS